MNQTEQPPPAGNSDKRITISLSLEESAARKTAHSPIGADRQAPAHTGQTMRFEA